MPTLDEIREKYPAYGDMGDGQLADSLYSKFYADMPRDQFNAKIGYAPPSQTGDFFRSIPRGMVSGLAGAASAGGQAAALEMSDPQMAAEIPGQEKTTGIVEQNITGQLHKPDTTGGRFGASVGEAIGSPASYVGPGGPAVKAGFAALGGAGAEAGGELTGQSVLGRIGGSLAATMSPLALTHLSPKIPAGRLSEIEQLRARGIEPTAGDVTGSPRVKRMEQMGDLPGGGASFTRNQEASARQYSRSLNREIGVDEELATPELLDRAESEIQSRIDAGYEGSQINYDKKLGDELVAVVQNAAKSGLPHEVAQKLADQVNFISSRFISRSSGPAYIPASSYRAITREGTGLDQRIRDVMDDALIRSANARGTREGVGRRQALADLKEAERQQDTLTVLRHSVADSSESGIEGLISPQRLRANLTKPGNKEVADAVERLRESGETGLFDLSRAGNTILRPLRERRETGWGYTIPGLISGMAGRAVNSRPGQALLKNQVAVPLSEFMPPPGWTATRAATGGADIESQHNMPKGWKVQRLR